MFLPLLAATDDWSTVHERSQFLDTGDYEEAVTFSRRLARVNSAARVIVYGRTPQGRDMFALVVSADRKFAPADLARSAKPLIFVQNGIHAGEIEGKDASLILLREMLITGKRADLLKGANFMFVPVYNADGHERRSSYNRINQNGPANMGWRSTAQNFNLNRDFMKLDAPESRAQVALLHRYRPDFYFDNHTTDGADYQYSVMLSVPSSPRLPAPMAAWSARLYATVAAQCDRDGFLTAPYFGGYDPRAESQRLTVEDFGPRYAHGYLSAMNRPSMLIETHMLKPYRERVDATANVMLHTIQRCIAEAPALKAMNCQADAEEMAGHPIPVLDTRMSDAERPMTFRAWRYAPFNSEVTGKSVSAWIREPVNQPATVRDQYVAALTVDPPAAYVVPGQWTEVIDRLRTHGLVGFTLKSPVTESLDGYRFADVKFAGQPFEGRFMPQYRVTTTQESVTLPKGSVVYPVAQLGGKLLVNLLEPSGPDSLARWGLFNMIFEQKEYFEDYSMEPIAAEMMRSDPKLRAEFQAALRDPAFAASPRARLQFFFERSKYADFELNRYPVMRLTAPQMALFRKHA